MKRILTSMTAATLTLTFFLATTALGNSLYIKSSIASPTSLQIKVPEKTIVEQEKPVLKMVGNGNIKSTLIVDGQKIAISGRTSIHFEATEEELKNGRVKAKGANVAYFNVPQAALTYEKINPDRIGVLGFAMSSEDGPQYMEYNEKTGTVMGTLHGYMDADYMSDLVDARDAKNDVVETPKQKADVYIYMELTEPLSFKMTDEKMRQEGDISIELETYKDFGTNSKVYEVALEAAPIAVDYSIFKYIEIAKRLKIQPVRIGYFMFTKPYNRITAAYTGAGLDFGIPQLREQWAKADVVFTINSWTTVWDYGYRIFDSSEATALKGEVNVADAVEVFFVYDFSPVSMWGGGATWGVGSAGTKIITSDGNARGGIDFTHLAHEIGHSMGLYHPDGTPGVSTGTLMCPSGWMNDNPQINSQENKDNLTNPLFTFALKTISAGPDCEDSADCGSCP